MALCIKKLKMKNTKFLISFLKAITIMKENKYVEKEVEEEKRPDRCFVKDSNDSCRDNSCGVGDVDWDVRNELNH